MRLNLASPPRHRLVFRRNKGTRENSSVVIMVSRISPINLIVLKGRENPFLLASCSNCSSPTFSFVFFQPSSNQFLPISSMSRISSCSFILDDSSKRVYYERVALFLVYSWNGTVMILSNFRSNILNSGLYLRMGNGNCLNFKDRRKINVTLMPRGFDGI